MIRLLRLAAMAVMAACLVAFGWSFPWSRWVGWEDLAALPGGQMDSIFWVLAVPSLVLLLVTAAGAALALLALADVVERLDSIRRQQFGHTEAAVPAPSSPPSSASSWNRLASARLLRITAIAVIAATVATMAMQYPWWLMIWRRETMLHDTYFVIDAAGTFGLLALEVIAALVLVALARILDRLDDVQGRMSRDD